MATEKRRGGFSFLGGDIGSEEEPALQKEGMATPGTA